MISDLADYLRKYPNFFLKGYYIEFNIVLYVLYLCLTFIF